MKTSILSSILAVGFALLSLGTLQAQPPVPPATPTNRPVNYILRVEWKDNKATNQTLQLITMEGTFKLNTTQPGGAKGGDFEPSISVTLEGTLKVLNPEQGQVQFFLGRTVPYVVRSGSAGGPSSIQQRQEGVNCAFVVTFGKPVLVQKDALGEVYVTVQREQP